VFAIITIYLTKSIIFNKNLLELKVDLREIYYLVSKDSDISKNAISVIFLNVLISMLQVIIYKYFII